MSESRAGILQISIQDFRGIDRLDLDFRDPSGEPNRIVVLAGPNGCGKTAVLEACLLVNGHERLVRGSTGIPAVRAGASHGMYRIKATTRGLNGLQEVTCDTTRTGTWSMPGMYFSSWRAVNLVGAVGVSSGPNPPKRPRSEQERLKGIKQFLVNAKAYELFSDRKRTAEGRFTAVINRLNAGWELFYPGQEFVVEPLSADGPELGFDVFLLRGDSLPLPVSFLSAGQLELFTFAGSLATESIDRPKLIVVDEPELHLDPQWHRQVLRLLQTLQPTSQIIVATHSPEVYDSVRSFERHFLVPADDPRAREWSPRAASEEHVA